MLRVLLLVVTIIATASVCSANANMLEEIITLSSMSPAAFADSLASSGLAQIVQLEKTPSLHIAADSSAYRPVVLSHGMGDAATNSGMVEIRNLISQTLGGAYATNVAFGSDAGSDASSTFFKSMDEQVDIFAQAVKADEKLASGFNAIGFSQGNLVIRGYIEKYNSPPVYNFVSVHGPLMGVSMVPQCSYSNSICKLFNKFLVSSLAYYGFAQNLLAQSNYFRDPTQLSRYTKFCKFLPALNNEADEESGMSKNSDYDSNMGSLESLVLVKANSDRMVIPNDSEWFGYFQDGSDSSKWTMEDAPWYKSDAFGLKTLNEAGKISFLSTDGDHLQVTEAFIADLVSKYFKN